MGGASSTTIEFLRLPCPSVGPPAPLLRRRSYNYLLSYGVQLAERRVYTAADLKTTRGRMLITDSKYYPTLASNWAAYSASFAGSTPEEIREGKLGYITSSISSGSMVVYEVSPTRIIITAPFLMNMAPPDE